MSKNAVTTETRLMERCCEAMHEDGYCEAHNPLGGSFAAIRAALDANPPTYKPARKEHRWGRRQGSAGYGRQRRG
jgi:hypothetical protein